MLSLDGEFVRKKGKVRLSRKANERWPHQFQVKWKESTVFASVPRAHTAPISSARASPRKNSSSPSLGRHSRSAINDLPNTLLVSSLNEKGAPVISLKVASIL